MARTRWLDALGDFSACFRSLEMVAEGWLAKKAGYHLAALQAGEADATPAADDDEVFVIATE